MIFGSGGEYNFQLLNRSVLELDIQPLRSGRRQAFMALHAEAEPASSSESSLLRRRKLRL